MYIYKYVQIERDVWDRKTVRTHTHTGREKRERETIRQQQDKQKRQIQKKNRQKIKRDRKRKRGKNNKNTFFSFFFMRFTRITLSNQRPMMNWAINGRNRVTHGRSLLDNYHSLKRTIYGVDEAANCPENVIGRQAVEETDGGACGLRSS